MRRGKLKAIDLRFFLIPFFALFFLFAIISYFSINNHIKNTYATLEKYSLEMADSYTRRIINSNIATDIIIELIDEKLLSASKDVLELADKIDYQALAGLTDKHFVDEISIYNQQGEVINSTTPQMLGWKAYPDHPVYNFMTGAEDLLIEDIRANTETGVFYKFIYARDKDNNFVQIGVLADKINAFLHRFKIEQLINEITQKENVVDMFFTNAQYELVAGSDDEIIDFDLDQDDICQHFHSEEARIGEGFLDWDDSLHVCAPVIVNNQRIGTLTIIWSKDTLESEVKEIILDNVLRFILVTAILGIVLYYAYQKNKQNIEIAYYDQLTGLPNHEYLKEYLAQSIKGAKNKKIAVLLLNCENFSLINLTYGFQYGDGILRELAKLIVSSRSPKDMLFRLDADKFVLIVNNYQNTVDLENLAERIINNFRNPEFNIYKHQYLNLKIAIYKLDEPSITVDQVLHNLSHGISLLKGDPTQNYLIYNLDMKEALAREEKIEMALIEIINGLSEDYLYMVYQPLLDIKENSVVGFEALARLKIPEIGQVPPLEFITLAEKRNLIFSLGNIILKQITEFLQKLKNSGRDDLFVSVNISGLQLLRDGLFDVFKEIIGPLNKDWKQLVFEITESVLVDKFALINERLAEIKKMGSSVALDDFGISYSAFSELRNLNIDMIKIDRSFIGKIGGHDEGILITQDIIAMSQRLGLSVVAEGVENEAQMKYLMEHGCDIVQGYYISKPLPQDKAINFVESV